jgi:ketosteroid isomerase-like protein
MKLRNLKSNFNPCVAIKAYGHLLVTSLITIGIGFSSSAFADDESDVLAIVYQYGDLENDLETQADLMRSDRIHIANGVRQTNEAKNRTTQVANREAEEALNGGKTEFVTTIENPIVSIHGDVAIASFTQWWNIYPHEGAPSQSNPAWVSLVMIKDGRNWLVKHTHQSPLQGN